MIDKPLASQSIPFRKSPRISRHHGLGFLNVSRNTPMASGLPCSPSCYWQSSVSNELP